MITSNMNGVTSMESTELEMVSFTAYDRCDQCGVQALAKARHEGFTDLMFCWHHKEEHGEKLLDAGWEIIEDYATYESYKTPQHLVSV